MSDGTPTGTVLVEDTAPGAASAWTSGITLVGHRLLFVANAGSGNRLRVLSGFNAAPAAVDDAYTQDPNTTLVVPAGGVLANDSDAENDSLTAALVSGPATGTLDFTADGAFTYTPPLNYTVLITFTYQANDGIADSNAAIVTLMVEARKMYLPLVQR
jgi:hypothetical protein